MSKWQRMKFPTDRWHPLLVNDPVYGVAYTVLWNVKSGAKEHAAVLNYLQKDWGIPIPQEHANIANIGDNTGQCSGYRKNILIMFAYDSKPGVGVLVHECFHAINFVAIWNNLKFNIENDEHMAYYLEWLCSAIARHGHKYKLWNTED